MKLAIAKVIARLQPSLCQHVYLAVKHIYDNSPDTLFDIDGHKWKVGSGRRGYRYSLNCRELGVVILFGSHYLEPEYNGHHLKN